MKFQSAKRYDEFAYAQKIVADELLKMVVKSRSEFAQIYEIGAGSGVLTRRVISSLKYDEIVLNDIYKSDFMASFQTQIGDILTLNLPQKLDLIISSSVFQWIENLDKLRDKLYLSLKNDGILAFSMFCDGTLQELSSFTKQSLKYKNNSEIKEKFAVKFEILGVKNEEIIAKFSSLKELLNHLKQTGVNNLNGNFKLTKENFKLLEAHFDGNFALTYKYINLICKKR
ncbi:methyltransferase domain-containing protein [Campylobacter geochelonis]|uniref:methyltransferase domain-containing protein n=1 Tax=Campylobacter geochelonis TaxID=1780362 RepID=UPI000770A11F|nr:methyltransferase domain-containing protein [Campylobacter geochelonis]CZE48659.1 putative biotin synthesis protein [Campylobacter geochelonis]